ncbi:helix-turn-helix transcriptional regulator [Streptomyces syringium]
MPGSDCGAYKGRCGVPADHSPTVRRRRLGAELRRLREQAGLTAEQVGEHLTCHASKVGRIENGRSGVRILDLRTMLDLYEVGDSRVREALTALAKEGKKRGWWQQYSDVLSTAAAEYVSLEAAASHIKDFQPILVPGLLQTEDYVQALMDGGRPDDTPDQISMRVRLRMERQSILSGEAPPLLWAVVGEAALRNQVGGPATMRHQIKALLEVSDKPNVTLQILPFTAGAHPGVDGAFTVLSMPEQDEQEVILVEAMTSSLYLETEQQVSRYKFAFNHIRAAAASPSQSRDLLRRALDDYRDSRRLTSRDTCR